VPAGVASFKVLGQVRYLPFSGGINFYIGNNADYKKTINTRPGAQWDELTEMPFEYDMINEQAKERFFLEKTKAYIFSEPLSFLKGLCYKTAQFVNSREMPRNMDIYVFRKWSGLLVAGVWKKGGFGFPFGLLLPLAVVGVVFHCRKVSVPIWLFMIFYPAAVILVFVTARYRVPIVPVMSVLAAGGGFDVLQMIREKRWKKPAAAAVIIFMVILLGSIPGPFYEEQINYEPELYYVLGGSLRKRGKIEDAMQAYSKAINLKTDYSEAHYNLAIALSKQGKTEEAIGHYEKAIEARPDDARAYNNLGLALQSLGRVDEAISRYHQALRLKPDHALAYNNLGLAHISNGNYDAAIDSFEQALKIRPDYLNARINLGKVLLYRDRYDDALEHYRWALQLNPECTEALHSIARILATHPVPQKRDVIQAISLAQRAAELTRYKDAFVLNTLLIAYASAGRFDPALKTAQQALDLALADQNNELADDIRRQMEFIKQQKP
jgi:tetratricopeptide (TPR) repeat protein